MGKAPCHFTIEDWIIKTIPALIMSPFIIDLFGILTAEPKANIILYPLTVLNKCRAIAATVPLLTDQIQLCLGNS